VPLHQKAVHGEIRAFFGQGHPFGLFAIENQLQILSFRKILVLSHNLPSGFCCVSTPEKLYTPPQGSTTIFRPQGAAN
jgi:hypothetical protein